IAGTTGCGKTNLILNILLSNFLKYDDVMIYTTTPYQNAYKYLRDSNQEFKRRFNTNKDFVTFHDPKQEAQGGSARKGSKIIDPSDLDKDKTHVIIFDDVMNEEQKVMTDYFCRGRHNNVNVFYLCQSIHQIKKHGIRQNANIFVLFQQDKKNIKVFL